MLSSSSMPFEFGTTAAYEMNTWVSRGRLQVADLSERQANEVLVMWFSKIVEHAVAAMMQGARFPLVAVE
ncbi:hypothetical protein AAHA92_05475 [Salvia divinorum]|uniref:Uncharacterized protein n=1 Tax=Salvia divinorum TaxID=28513 RepID=A0ABD1I6L0_SALDI